MECTQNKSYLTFSSSDSSFNKYPEVSLNNLSFFIFFFQSAMGLCLSLESPSFDYIYVNSLRDFLLVNFNNPLDRPPCSEDFCFFSSFLLLFFPLLFFVVFIVLHKVQFVKYYFKIFFYFSCIF